MNDDNANDPIKMMTHDAHQTFFAGLLPAFTTWAETVFPMLNGRTPGVPSLWMAVLVLEYIMRVEIRKGGTSHQMQVAIMRTSKLLAVDIIDAVKTADDADAFNAGDLSRAMQSADSVEDFMRSVVADVNRGEGG